MAAQIDHHCVEHANLFDCPDALVFYELRFDEYGIIIHDGGTSVQLIHYCPWCGTALPVSKRERWFETLAGLGFDDPTVQAIPTAFTSDAWYRPNSSDDHLTANQREAEQSTAIVRLPSEAITNWDSFHAVCQQVFGFPVFYGRNMNTWIDCLTDLDEGNGMSRFHLRSGEKLVIEVPETNVLVRRVPDVVAGLIEGTAAVNQRHIEDGKEAIIVLVFL